MLIVFLYLHLPVKVEVNMANGLIQLIIDNRNIFALCFIISIVLCVFDINYKLVHRSVGENDYR